MKNKLKVVPALLLIIALLGTGIYFNHRVTSQPALQTSTVDTKSQDFSTAEVPAAIIPVDTNKVLSSGFTIGEVKVKLDTMKSKLTDRSKYPEKDVNELLEKLAADYGTTMNEVNSAKDAPPAVVQPKVETPATVAPKADVEQPAVTKPAATKPATTKPAVTKPQTNNTEVKVITPSVPTQATPNTSGAVMDDAFKGSYEKITGPSTPDPNFIINAQ